MPTFPGTSPMSPKHPRKAKETMCASINKVLHCSAKYYKNKCLDYWGPKPTPERSHGETALKCPRRRRWQSRHSRTPDWASRRRSRAKVKTAGGKGGARVIPTRVLLVLLVGWFVRQYLMQPRLS